MQDRIIVLDWYDGVVCSAALDPAGEQGRLAVLLAARLPEDGGGRIYAFAPLSRELCGAVRRLPAAREPAHWPAITSLIDEAIREAPELVDVTRYRDELGGAVVWTRQVPIDLVRRAQPFDFEHAIEPERAKRWFAAPEPGSD